MDLGKTLKEDTIKTEKTPSSRARPDSHGTSPGGKFIDPSVPSHLASDDSGTWEIRNAKGRARCCGHLSAIDKHEALVLQASQVPIPDHDNDLAQYWADVVDTDSESDATNVCGTPLSDTSALHDRALSLYVAKLDPESPEYVDGYSSKWRQVTAREPTRPRDVWSRRTGTRWRPAESEPVGPVGNPINMAQGVSCRGNVEALNFFRRPPAPV